VIYYLVAVCHVVSPSLLILVNLPKSDLVALLDRVQSTFQLATQVIELP
jgi:hypothetical protein